MSHESTERKHIITISGKPGSGKSTTSKAVAAQLEYQHFSSGDLFREISQQHGHDILAGNAHAEKDTSIDEQVDRRLQEMGEQEDRIVIDSRLAWHWMPQSFKVYLDLDIAIAAARIISNMDEARLASEHIPSDPTEYAGQLTQRLASESRRYESLYNVDPYDVSNYDLVVNTAEHSVEEAVALIIESFHAWRND